MCGVPTVVFDRLMSCLICDYKRGALAVAVSLLKLLPVKKHLAPGKLDLIKFGEIYFLLIPKDLQRKS